MKIGIKGLKTNEKGTSLSEYVLLVALIALLKIDLLNTIWYNYFMIKKLIQKFKGQNLNETIIPENKTPKKYILPEAPYGEMDIVNICWKLGVSVDSDGENLFTNIDGKDVVLDQELADKILGSN